MSYVKNFQKNTQKIDLKKSRLRMYQMNSFFKNQELVRKKVNLPKSRKIF